MDTACVPSLQKHLGAGIKEAATRSLNLIAVALLPLDYQMHLPEPVQVNAHRSQISKSTSTMTSTLK